MYETEDPMYRKELVLPVLLLSFGCTGAAKPPAGNPAPTEPVATERIVEA